MFSDATADVLYDLSVIAFIIIVYEGAKLLWSIWQDARQPVSPSELTETQPDVNMR